MGFGIVLFRFYSFLFQLNEIITFILLTIHNILYSMRCEKLFTYFYNKYIGNLLIGFIYGNI
jgi:hypothetical protein